jgi:hypothetical protein
MYAVVNQLPIRPDADWQDIAEKFGKFAAATSRDYPKLKVAVVMKASPTEAIFLGVYEDQTTAEHVSANVAAPWFAEHIRPYLAGPAQRLVGEVISGEVAGG